MFGHHVLRNGETQFKQEEGVQVPEIARGSGMLIEDSGVYSFGQIQKGSSMNFAAESNRLASTPHDFPLAGLAENSEWQRIHQQFVILSRRILDLMSSIL